MTDLVTAFSRALTDAQAYPSEDRSPRFNVEIIVAASGGSGRAAGRYLGVAESTLRGWRKGVVPRRSNRELASAARQAVGEHWPAFSDAYHGERTLAISGRVRVSSDVRPRTIYPGRIIPLQVMQSILRTWLSGDDAKTEAQLYRAIDHYYHPVAFDRLDAAWFE
jgi:hypothetical protein